MTVETPHLARVNVLFEALATIYVDLALVEDCRMTRSRPELRVSRDFLPAEDTAAAAFLDDLNEP